MPRPVDPLSIDFAALRTLATVHRLRSFTEAAEALGVTQSTVSYAIDRLRGATGDPLFVRQGAAVVPTERCEELAARAVEWLEGWEAAAAPDRFDPARAEGRVTLSLNYYERATILPAVMRRVRAEAPGLAVDVIATGDAGEAQLRHGEADLLISPLRLSGGWVHARRLLRERYVLVRDPARGGAWPGTLEALAAAPQAVVRYGGGWRSGWIGALEAAGLAPAAALTIPSPGDLPRLLAGSDLVCILPERLARSFGDALAVGPCPAEAPFDVDMFWTARVHASARHRWVRSVVLEEVRREG